jgi:hypothetical protein
MVQVTHCEGRLVIIISLLTIQTDKPQYDYRYSISGSSRVTTGVEFNRTAATQGAHPLYFSFTRPPSCECRLSRPLRERAERVLGSAALPPVMSLCNATPGMCSLFRLPKG